MTVIIKYFTEFLEEQSSNQLRTLNVFDVDDTLFKSSASVLVKKDGKTVKELDTAGFNHYKLKPGEEYDFGQFRSAEQFRKSAQPIVKMIERAQRAIDRARKGDRTIIITARADLDDKHLFLQTFRDHGFPVDDTYIERSGNLDRFKRGVATHIRKGVILRKYIMSGAYTRVRIWDDHAKNLDFLLDICKRLGIEAQAFLVDPATGNTTRYG